jgi:PhnB protein
VNKTITQSDLEKKTLTIERRFNAPRSRVWQAYTEAALLDRWWAPEPYTAETVTMDFRVGGYWHYAMIGPDGARHFGRMDYQDIEPQNHYASVDVFCDENGIADDSLPRQEFVTTFVDEGKTTQVVVVASYDSVEDLRKVIEMGIEEGITRAQDQLEQLLG